MPRPDWTAALVQPLAVRGWIDPAAVFGTLLRNEELAFWIDAGPHAATGWSYLGAGEADAPHGAPMLAEVRDVPAAGQRPEDAWPAGPFRGGWVGWLGYEHGAQAAGAPAASGEHAAGTAWMRATRWLAFDHAARRVWAVAPAATAAVWRDQAERTARSVLAVQTDARPLAATARHTPAEYIDMIGRCRAAIREGDAYQLCLTTRFTAPAPPDDPLDVFLRLRARTPAPRGGYYRFGDIALASASPEQFLTVDRGVVTTSPIKGTRPRGADAASDAALAAELAASPKERAENVMIVDLVRNDLSRVGVPSTVGVDALLRVDSYAAVHQLVSTVSARLRTPTTVGDLLDAAFPAGSMTGAPKLSAMGILHGLESAPRGIYSGCAGWVGIDGDLDLSMVIRSAVMTADGAYVGAGGGITWGSVPDDEIAEVAVKARAPLAALGAVLPPEWAHTVG